MDDSIPLVDEEGDKTKNLVIHRVVGVVIISLFVLLFCSTILLAILYFGTYKEQVPAWNGPNNTQNGFFRTAAVASDNVRCSEVGRDVLIEGGNAVDAAVAVMICLGVVNPMSSGLGGGHFMTIYNISTGKCSVVDAREVAPLAAAQNMFDNNTEGAQKGWKAMAVPGELHGLRTEYENFGGRVPWSRLFMPSIDMLNKGVPVSQALDASLKEEEKNLLAEPTLSDFLDPKTKEIYKYGDVMRNRLLFRDTLKYLANAEDPIQEFYNGSMTELFLSEFEENDGLLTLEDFQKYSSIVRKESEVIVTELNGRFICGPPPPSSSAITQSIIKVLDSYAKEFDQSTIKSNVEILHKFLEVSKFAYSMRSKLGDMAFEPDALAIAKNVTSDSFVENVRQKLTNKAHKMKYYGDAYAPLMDKGTSNLAVIDAEGNAVVATTTINLIFGARVASESSGIIWNSQMDDFSLPNGPNYYGYPPAPTNFIRPGKRPQSSISPLIVVNKDTKKVELAIGSAGGSQIISSVSSVASRVLTLGWDVKTAVNAPRIHNQFVPNITEYEPSFPKQYVKKLAIRGHKMTQALAVGETTAIQAKGQKLFAIADYRKGTECQPAGF